MIEWRKRTAQVLLITQLLQTIQAAPPDIQNTDSLPPIICNMLPRGYIEFKENKYKLNCGESVYLDEKLKISLGFDNKYILSGSSNESIKINGVGSLEIENSDINKLILNLGDVFIKGNNSINSIEHLSSRSSFRIEGKLRTQYLTLQSGLYNLGTLHLLKDAEVKAAGQNIDNYGKINIWENATIDAYSILNKKVIIGDTLRFKGNKITNSSAINLGKLYATLVDNYRYINVAQEAVLDNLQNHKAFRSNKLSVTNELSNTAKLDILEEAKIAGKLRNTGDITGQTFTVKTLENNKNIVVDNLSTEKLSDRKGNIEVANELHIKDSLDLNNTTVRVGQKLSTSIENIAIDHADIQAVSWELKNLKRLSFSKRSNVNAILKSYISDLSLSDQQQAETKLLGLDKFFADGNMFFLSDDICLEKDGSYILSGVNAKESFTIKGIKELLAKNLAVKNLESENIQVAEKAVFTSVTAHGSLNVSKDSKFSTEDITADKVEINKTASAVLQNRAKVSNEFTNHGKLSTAEKTQIDGTLHNLGSVLGRNLTVTTLDNQSNVSLDNLSAENLKDKNGQINVANELHVRKSLNLDNSNVQAGQKITTSVSDITLDKADIKTPLWQLENLKKLSFSENTKVAALLKSELNNISLSDQQEAETKLLGLDKFFADGNMFYLNNDIGLFKTEEGVHALSGLNSTKSIKISGIDKLLAINLLMQKLEAQNIVIDKQAVFDKVVAKESLEISDESELSTTYIEAKTVKAKESAHVFLERHAKVDEFANKGTLETAKDSKIDGTLNNEGAVQGENLDVTNLNNSETATVNLENLNVDESSKNSGEIKVSNDFATKDLENTNNVYTKNLKAKNSIKNTKNIACETLDKDLQNLDNTGNILVAEEVNLDLRNLKNSGTFHSAKAMNVKADNLNNEHGNLGGAKGTTVESTDKIKSKDGIIGVGGETKIKGQAEGKVVTDKLVLDEGFNFSGMTISAKEIISNMENFNVQGVEFETDLLTCNNLKSFNLSPQTKVKKTVLRLADGDFTFSNPYDTKGSLEIESPHAHKITFAAAITANLGRFITPQAAQIFLAIAAPGSINPPATLCLCELYSESAIFDCYDATIGVINGHVKANLIKIGRLVKDEMREMMSLNQDEGGTDFVFKVFGQENIAWNYHNCRIFRLPVFSKNSAYLNVKDKFILEGKIEHQGLIDTDDLELSTPNPSEVLAGKINVRRNFTLNGELQLNRVFGFIRGTLYHYKSPIINGNAEIIGIYPLNYNFAISDEAIFRVAGKTLGNGIIRNHATAFHTESKTPNICIESQNFSASFKQQFFEGTKAARDAILTPSTNDLCKYRIRGYWGHFSTHNYKQFFLDKSDNANKAQQFFPASTSFDKPVEINDPQDLKGNFAAPEVTIEVGTNSVTIGDSSPYHIPPEDAIQSLLDKGFNPNSVYLTPELKEELQHGKPVFAMRERFWFNAERAAEFYNNVTVYVRDKNGVFKLGEHLTFAVSPELLLQTVQEKCQKVLKRGFIEMGETIDHGYLYKLHENTKAYVTAHNLTNVLAITNGKLAENTKPILFYTAAVNEQNVEVYAPVLGIPQALIDELTGAKGSLLKADTLLVMPAGLGQKQLEDAMSNDPALLSNALTTETPAPTVNLGGTFRTKNLAVLNKGDVVSSASINAEDKTLIASGSNLHFKSLVERIYTGNMNNYYDRIAKQAEINSGILKTYSRKDTIFEAANTRSKTATNIVADGNCSYLNTELHRQTLIEERGRKSYSSTCYGGTTIVGSHHGSGGVFNVTANNIYSVAATYSAPEEINFNSHGSSIFGEKHNTSHYSKTESSKGSSLGGTKTKTSGSQSYSARSVGNVFKTERLNFKSKIENIFVNLTIDAKKILSDAPSTVLERGTEFYSSNSYSSRSNAFWQSMSQHMEQHKTFTSLNIKGEFVATGQLIIEQIRGESLEYLDSIKGEDIIRVMLDELHESKTTKQSGPSAGLKAVIGIATTIICTLAMPASAGTSSAMIAAATSATASTMATGLVDHKGNFGRVLKDLGKKDNLKNLMISIAAAGVGAQFKLPTANGQWQNHFCNAGIRNFTRAGLNIIVKHEKLKNAFVDALRSTVVDGFATLGAGAIGEHTSGFTHKIAHGVLGAALGAAVSPDNLRLGAISGAAGAVTVELIAEGLARNLSKEIPEIIEKNPNITTAADLTNKIQERAKEYGEYAKLCTAVGSLFAGLDVNVADRTASNAIDNNFVMCVPAAIIAGESLCVFLMSPAGQRLLQTAPQLFASLMAMNHTMDKAKDKLDKEAKAKVEAQQQQAQTGGQSYASTGGPSPENDPNDDNKRKTSKPQKIKDGPDFPNLKSHAEKHSNLHPNSYYNQAVRHTQTGRKFLVRHNGENRILYITRAGSDGRIALFNITSTSRNGRTIFTHVEKVTEQYLKNQGITLPKGL